MKRDPSLILRQCAALAMLGSCVLLASSCSRSSSKEAHLKRADAYFDAGSYDDAIIEYKNVLQADRLNPRAIARLGVIFYNEGNIGNAVPLIIRAHALLPDDLDIRIKVGQISLARGNAKDSRDQADSVLQQDPKNQEAPILLAESSIKPDEVESAREQLKDLPVAKEDSGASLVGLAMLDLRQHRLASAEATLQSAVAIDPKLASAEFYLGTVLWLSGDVAHADQAYAAACKLAPAHSPMRLKYAQFKIRTGDLEAAQRQLEEMVHNTPDYLPASILLAETEIGQKKLPEAKALIAKVLLRDGNNSEALLLGATIDLAMGNTSAAVTTLEHTKTLYPRIAQTYLLLGQGYMSSGDLGNAITNLGQAIELNPNLTEAVLLLAKAELKKGDFKAAAVTLAPTLRKTPDNAQALLLQAEALRGQGDPDGALEVYRRIEKSRPKDPQMALYSGLMLLKQDRRDEARAEFNRALQIEPSYFAAIEQLITIDLMEGKYSAALEKGNDAVAKHPNAELPRLFMAKIYLAQGDNAHAEEALAKAIELNPDGQAGYFLLAQIYSATNRQDKALADLKQVIAKNPNAVGALMMMGVIYEGQKNYDAARDAYEKTLAVNPQQSSAVNNLAYLYSERFGQLDKGLAMAEHARELLPTEPHVADTLGWILYKKRQFPRALSLLQESASSLSTEADVQFHLGMALYMVGDEDRAAAALKNALSIPGGFSGSDEAKRRLSILALDTSVSGAAERTAMEKSLSDAADDPVALNRLAGMHEHDGALDKAIDEYQSALEINPASVPTMLSLARIYESQHDMAKALDIAKSAHKVAPNDISASKALSHLAYVTGDYQWAYSLLQEVVQSAPDDKSVLFALANSEFSVGKTQEAKDTMQRAVQSGAPGPEMERAKRFVDTMAVLDYPDLNSFDSRPIEESLKLDPGYGPALLALAQVDEAKRANDAAIANYEKLLKEYPDFSPAKRRLAVFYSSDPGKDEQTSALAESASEAFPADPELGKVMGVIAYRKKNFTMAADLLNGSAQQRKGDAETLYYLGMSQLQLSQATSGRKALQDALSLGLKPDLAAEANKALAAAK